MAGESVPLSVPIAAIVSHRELTPINDYTQTQNNETKITPLLERESRCHRIVPQPMLPYYSSAETPQEIKKVNKTLAAGSSRLGGEGGGGCPHAKNLATCLTLASRIYGASFAPCSERVPGGSR